MALSLLPAQHPERVLLHNEIHARPAEIIEAVKPHLSETLFPGGETAGWWVKCVQLDLEAKGLLKRGVKGPVRLYQPS